MARLGPAVTMQSYAIELEMKRGRYDRALARLDRITSQYTRKEGVLKRRGEILEAAGRVMEAQVAYTEALDAVSVLPEGRRNTPAIIELVAFLNDKLRSTPPRGSEEP